LHDANKLLMYVCIACMHVFVLFQLYEPLSIDRVFLQFYGNQRRHGILSSDQIAVLTYKVLHDTATRYLGPLDRVADLRGRRELRSASSSCLVVPMFRLSTVGSRTFNVSGPRIWNGLPEDVVLAPTFSSFRRRLKPFLFKQSYPDIIIYLYIWHYSGPCSDVYHLGHSKNHWTKLNWTEGLSVPHLMCRRPDWTLTTTRRCCGVSVLPAPAIQKLQTYSLT